MNSPTDSRFMEFRLDDQLFAIPLLGVREVISRPEITPVPNTPVHYEGMFNLRGQVLGIVNTRRKLNLKPVPGATPTARDAVVIVVEIDGSSIGLLVDEVTRVLHAEDGKISPAPLKEDDPAHRYIESVIQSAGHLVAALRINRLLESEIQIRNRTGATAA